MGRRGIFRGASERIESSACSTPRVQHTRQVQAAHAPVGEPRCNVQQDIARRASRIPQTAQEKLQHGITTSEGLTLSMGANGEVLASVGNTSNSVAFGYVRKDGSYSRASSPHTIYSTTTGGSSRLLAVTQRDTYAAQVTHHDGFRTTIALRVDPSVDVLHLKLGAREYLIRSSDIVQAKQAASNVAMVAPKAASSLNNKTQDSQAPQISVESSPSDRSPSDQSIEENSTLNSLARAAQPSRAAPKTTRSAKGTEAAAPSKKVEALPKPAEATRSFLEKAQRTIVDTAKQIKDNAAKVYERSRESLQRTAPGNKTTGAETTTTSTSVTQQGAPRPVEGKPTGELSPSAEVKPTVEVAPTKSVLQPTPEPAVAQPVQPGQSSPADTKLSTEAKATNLARLRQTAERFGSTVKASEWARNNPLKATVAMLAVSEAVTGAMESGYEDDDVHSAVPKLIQMLTKDIDGLESLQGRFTTAEGGLLASIAAESTSAVGDVSIAVTGIAGAEKGIALLSRLTGVSKVPGISVLGKTFGRLGGGAFATWDGYASFKDGQFVEMNDRQIAGTAGGSYALGVAAFAFSGPPGWVVGALSATSGMLYGVSVGLAEENKKLSISSPRKRAVVASIQRALAGFVHPEDSETVKQRPHSSVFSQEEREQIEELARLDALANFVTSAPPEQAQALGFTKVSQGDSAQDLSTANQANYQRMLELLGEKSWFSWEHPLDTMKREHPEATAAFMKSISDARLFYEDLYRRSIRVSYEHQGELNTFGIWGEEFAGRFGINLGSSSHEGKIVATSELHAVSKEISAALSASDRDNPAKVLNVIAQHLPGLELIMRSEHGRNELISALEDASGGTGVFQRALSLETAAEELQKAATGVTPAENSPSVVPPTAEPPTSEQRPEEDRATEPARELVRPRKERLDPSRTVDATDAGALRESTAA